MEVDEKELLGVTDDSIGEELQAKQLESLQHQLELYEGTLKSIIAQREDYVKQCAIDEEVWSIRFRDNNHEKLEQFRQFKYETDPRYWELVRMKMEYEYRNLINQKESTLKSFDFRESEIKEQLEAVSKKLIAVKGE